METKQKVTIYLDDGVREPRISVSFKLEGNEFSKEYIWEKLRLEPSRFRTKEDCPVDRPNFSDEFKPGTTWELETGYEDCMSVSRQLEKLIERLRGKEVTIIQLCKELNLRLGFSVSIEADLGYMPAMMLGRETLAFLAKIGADIGFSFY